MHCDSLDGECVDIFILHGCLIYDMNGGENWIEHLFVLATDLLS
jgi:hypothetical protein